MGWVSCHYYAPPKRPSSHFQKRDHHDSGGSTGGGGAGGAGGVGGVGGGGGGASGAGGGAGSFGFTSSVIETNGEGKNETLELEVKIILA